MASSDSRLEPFKCWEATIKPMVTAFPYDAHVYTNATEGRDSLNEVVRAAEATGLELVVIADNYDRAGDDLRDRTREVVAVNLQAPLMVVPGIEASIRDVAGTIGLPPETARLVPVVYVHLSGRTRGIAIDPPASKARYLANLFHALLNVATIPAVTALARPFNIGQFPTPLSPSQLPRSALDELASAMNDHDVAFEISARMHWWFPELSVEEFTNEYAQVIAAFAARNVKFLVSSEARSAGAVGNLLYAVRLMKAAGVERSQVIDLPQFVSRKMRLD